MAAISGDGDFGIALCKVLGLDPKKTKDIFISCKTNNAVAVIVKFYLQQEETEGLLTLVGKYHLEENAKNEEPKET